jgi:hypothetical protein
MFSKDDFEEEIWIYKLIMHFNGSASLISSGLAIFLIMYKSTRQMAEYKFYLLNIVLWSTALDTYLGILYLPMLTLPASGMGASLYARITLCTNHFMHGQVNV